MLEFLLYHLLTQRREKPRPIPPSTKKRLIFAEGLQDNCEVCGQKRNFHIVYAYDRKDWLFSSVSEEKYFLACEACDQGIELPKKEVEGIYGRPKLPFWTRYGAATWIVGAAFLIALPFIFLLIFGPVNRDPPSPTWSKVTSRDGKCTVSMPGVPEAEFGVTDTKFGKVTKHSLNLRQNAGACFYSLASADFTNIGPPADNDVLDAVASSIAARLPNPDRVLVERIDLNGHPGRSIEVHTKDWVMKAKIIFCRPILYEALFSARKTNLSPNESDKFLQSFSLNSKQPP